MKQVSSSSLVFLSLLVACGPGDEGEESPSSTPEVTPTAVPATATPTPPEPTPTAVPLPEGCNFYVTPSDDDQTTVQTALIEAATGETVCLSAGTFSFVSELSLAVEGVTLQGESKETTILDFTNQVVGGGANGIIITSNGCTIRGLTVQETPGDGIRADKVEGVTFDNVGVIWFVPGAETSGAYGLYPVGSTDVLIQESIVQGARDAGIYVGQSNNVLLVDNEARGNVAGIEIENTSDSEVVGNYAHGNTAGILVFNLPNLPVMDGKRAKVHDNLIEDNNTDNFAAEGNIIAIVPAGSGMFLLASDGNEFHDNIISGNISGGIFIISYSELLVGSYDDPNFDPYPESNWIHDNVFDNNGTDAQGAAAVVALAAGLSPRDQVPAVLWDGCMDPNKDVEPSTLINCLSSNVDAADQPATYGDFDLCGTEPFAEPSFDPNEVTCERETLPSIDL